MNPLEATKHACDGGLLGTEQEQGLAQLAT